MQRDKSESIPGVDNIKKLKFPLRLFNLALRHESAWGSGGIT
jgi:hypothetical protein